MWLDSYLKRKSVKENKKADNEKKSKSVIRQYSDSYISFRCSFAGNLTALVPLCMVRRKELSNSVMVSGKIKMSS